MRSRSKMSADAPEWRGFDWSATYATCTGRPPETTGCGDRTPTVHCETLLCTACRAPQVQPKRSRPPKKATTPKRPAPKPAAPRSRLKPVPDHTRRTVLDEYAAGRSVWAISNEHGIGNARVRRILADAGVQQRTHSEQLSLSHCGHLTSRAYVESVTASIAAAYSAGASIKKVARDHRVGYATAQRVLEAAGVQTRPKGGGSATRIKTALADLGVTSRVVKDWSVEQGTRRPGTPALPSMAEVEAYAAAHRGAA